jgi:copper chaperone
MKYVFKVPAMSCQHCKMRIEKALSPYSEMGQIEVDLNSKQVSVTSAIQPVILIKAIEAIGYHVEDTFKS